MTLLAAQGADAEVVPLIEFAPPLELTMLDSALTGLALGIYDWVTITSGTTVPYLAARAPLHVGAASGETPDPAVALAALLGNVQVAAVGPGTAAALERIGVVADLVPAGERSARGLLAEFPPPPPDGGGQGLTARVLVPHSDLAEPTLAHGLREAGWQVDDVVAYRTLSGASAGNELREAVRSGAFDAVLLSSASTVTNLVELVGTPPEGMVVCCIGPRTELAALELGLPVHVIPESASAEGLVEALARYAQEVPRP
ncbi:MAG TPA: uroporphyrinogen-III synthase [Actinotalea sp.]